MVKYQFYLNHHKVNFSVDKELLLANYKDKVKLYKLLIKLIKEHQNLHL
jgi:hypothetical protein